MKIAKKLKRSKQPKRSVLSFVALLRITWLDVSSFWRAIGGILAVYAVINFIFVASFSLLPSSQSLEEEIIAIFGNSAGRVIDSFALVGISLTNISSPSNALMQTILILITSMAIVWALRKLRGLQKIKIRQAYYEGPANIIPLVLVMVLLLLTLLPASFASTVLAFALPVVGSELEKYVVYLFALALIALTVYWFLIWWPAFYISMLPGTSPISAMRAAASLTKGRRIKIFSRQIAVLLVLISIFIAIVLPLSLMWQRIVPLSVYAMLIVVFGIGQVAYFNLYRSLIDEEPTKRSAHKKA